MSVIGKNIRKLRSVQGLNQTQFANIFGIKRANIGAYEEGRATPKTDLLLEIANRFSISIEHLLTRELTVNDLANFNADSIPNTPALSGINNKISLVRSSEWKRFFDGEKYNSQELTFPASLISGNIAFEVHDHIETDFENGTIIICTEVSHTPESGIFLAASDNLNKIHCTNTVSTSKKKNTRFFMIDFVIEKTSRKTSLSSRINKLEEKVSLLIKESGIKL